MQNTIYPCKHLFTAISLAVFFRPYIARTLPTRCPRRHGVFYLTLPFAYLLAVYRNKHAVFAAGGAPVFPG
jgi:hypothetical protein